MRCEPANSIIDRLGGTTAVAAAVGVKVSTVLRWRMPKAKGGTGGVIPHWHLHTIIADAERRGIDLNAAEFLPLRPDGKPPDGDGRSHRTGVAAV